MPPTPRLDTPSARTHAPELRTALLDWFAEHARPFPWRDERTPYRVWVAEVMLQQTRAVTVGPYFERWIARFPSVVELAAADEDEVLSLWQGLGYYRRARSLHRAAKHVVNAGGSLPTDEAGWRALPGVGAYTAAAIAALAQGAPVVAIDGNVRRVGARLLADPAPSAARLVQALRPLLPEDRPERATEALIELGATLCSPRSPRCAACPLAPACAAAAEGDPERYPVPKVRVRPERIRRWALVRVEGQRVWLERRPSEGLLGGLWGFPQTKMPPPGQALAPIRHVYTHLHLELVPVLSAKAPESSAPGDGSEPRPFAPDDLPALPMSNVDRIVLARLVEAGLLAYEA